MSYKLQVLWPGSSSSNNNNLISKQGVQSWFLFHLKLFPSNMHAVAGASSCRVEFWYSCRRKEKSVLLLPIDSVFLHHNSGEIKFHFGISVVVVVYNNILAGAKFFLQFPFLSFVLQVHHPGWGGKKQQQKVEKGKKTAQHCLTGMLKSLRMETFLCVFFPVVVVFCKHSL